MRGAPMNVTREDILMTVARDTRVAKYMKDTFNVLGLDALKYMQASTGLYFDYLPSVNASDTTYKFFRGQDYPASNLPNNEFEVGSAMAIQALAVTVGNDIGALTAHQFQFVTNFNIGNGDVLKEVLLGGQVLSTSGTVKTTNYWFYLDAPIVIPPQMKFFMDAFTESAIDPATNEVVCAGMYGTRVLLNNPSL